MDELRTKHGIHFQEKLTPFLRRLSSDSPAISSIYTFDPATETFPINPDRDILLEKMYTPVKGAIYKFRGRIVVLLSYTCAANCRYCERQDRVGVGLDAVGFLRSDDLVNIVSFIRTRPEINEVILSGGDPLMNRKGLEQFARLLAGLPQIRILRIHTRLPVQQPDLVDTELLAQISSLFPTSYLSVHVDHPHELTDSTEAVLTQLRRMGYVMLAQSVFLRGINDDASILGSLCRRLSELGIRPYYIYHCQAIPTTMRFVMPLTEEIRIMTQLREHLSGIAFPQHVIDLQHARGKVIVPSGHWDTDLTVVDDFDGLHLPIQERVMQPTES